MPPRYALYFVPEPGSALERFGRDWFAGRPPGIPAARWAELTAEPRRYGFHATLKPPFRLREGLREADLLTAAESFAGEPAVVAAPLETALLDGFLCLRPSRPEPALARLAEACVERLDRFRAPPTPVELARRRAQPLSSRQSALLECWGYPYVFDQFRFHMTLTGRRASDEAAMLAARAVPPDEPLHVASLCLCVQTEPGADFSLLRRLPLVGRRPDGKRS